MVLKKQFSFASKSTSELVPLAIKIKLKYNGISKDIAFPQEWQT